VTADPSDLTRDAAQWITWWPPSTQMVVWPLVRAGMSIGGAVQAVACAALLLGSLGWTRWWSRFALPERMIVSVAILMPWLRYASNAVFQYSAEILAFAATPWILLAVLDLVERPGRWQRAGLAGLLAGGMYWLKYSSVFIAASVIAFAGAQLWHRDRRSALIAVAACAVPVVALSAINRVYGGAANMFTAWHALRLSPETVLYAAGNPALMAADADSMLQFVLTNPDHVLLRSHAVVAALGIPGGLTLAWLLARSQRPEERLATTTMMVTLVLMIAAWIGSSAVSFETRHIAGAAIAALPAAIAIARRQWSSIGGSVRIWCLACGVAYVVIPWAIYGPVSVATKVFRQRGFVTTTTGLYNPLVSPRDARAAVARLNGACGIPDAVWYVPEPLTSLELSRRIVATHADFESLEELSSRHYRGAVSICALLPPKFEGNGKGRAIRTSFIDIRTWTRREAPGSAYAVWIGSPQ